jgi:hypothetical protein
LAPAPDALPIGHPRLLHHTVGTVAEPVTQRKHAQAIALACSVPQGVALCAECLTHRGRDGHGFLREFDKRMAEAVAETRPRQKRAQLLVVLSNPSVSIPRTR